MKTYTTRVMEGFDDEEYFFKIPDELLGELDWKSGDKVEWIDNGDGSYTLRKVK